MNSDKLFMYLLYCNICTSIPMAIIAPFFPPFAKERGIDPDLVGIIFSAHPIGSSLTAFIVGKLINKKNRIGLMSAGLGITGLALFGFSSLVLVRGFTISVTISIISRFLYGVGFSMYFTPFYAIIPDLFPEQVESKFASGSTMNSIGYLIGPAFGSLFYSLGGFTLPFIVFGSITIISGIILLFFRKQKIHSKTSLLNQDTINSNSYIEDVVRGKSVSYCHALMHFEIFILFLTVLVCNIQFQYYSPIIANFYKSQFNVPAEHVGYYLLAQSAGYGFFATILAHHPIPKYLKPYALFLGIFLSALTQFFYGPDPYLGFQPHKIFTICGQLMSGIFILLTYVQTVPFLNKFLRQFYQLQKSSANIASALFNIAMALGQLLGPLMSGFLDEYYGFQRSASILGCLMILIAFLNLYIVYKEITKKRNKDGVTILLSMSINQEQK